VKFDSFEHKKDFLEMYWAVSRFANQQSKEKDSIYYEWLNSIWNDPRGACETVESISKVLASYATFNKKSLHKKLYTTIMELVKKMEMYRKKYQSTSTKVAN